MSTFRDHRTCWKVGGLTIKNNFITLKNEKDLKSEYLTCFCRVTLQYYFVALYRSALLKIPRFFIQFSFRLANVFAILITSKLSISFLWQLSTVKLLNRCCFMFDLSHVFRRKKNLFHVFVLILIIFLFSAKSGGAAALPTPPPPRCLLYSQQQLIWAAKIVFRNYSIDILTKYTREEVSNVKKHWYALLP